MKNKVILRGGYYIERKKKFKPLPRVLGAGCCIEEKKEIRRLPKVFIVPYGCCIISIYGSLCR